MKDRKHLNGAAYMWTENDLFGFIQEAYIPACLLMRYEWGLPSKCPDCGVWSHHRIKFGKKNPIVYCPLCDQPYNADRYHHEAIEKLSKCLRRRFV